MYRGGEELAAALWNGGSFPKRRGRLDLNLRKRDDSDSRWRGVQCMVLEKIYMVTRGIQSKAVGTCECSRVPGCACNLPLGGRLRQEDLKGVMYL